MPTELMTDVVCLIACVPEILRPLDSLGSSVVKASYTNFGGGDLVRSFNWKRVDQVPHQMG